MNEDSLIPEDPADVPDFVKKLMAERDEVVAWIAEQPDFDRLAQMLVVAVLASRKSDGVHEDEIHRIAAWAGDLMEQLKTLATALVGAIDLSWPEGSSELTMTLNEHGAQIAAEEATRRAARQ